MSGDIGPRASMGSIGYFGNIDAIDYKMKSFIDSLISSGFRGKVDIQLRLDKDVWCEGMYFYFNWNTIYALLENTDLSLADFLYNMSIEPEMKIKFKSLWSVQINCGVPPFPYKMLKQGPTEILGIDSNNSKHLWILNLDSGELLCATGRGKYVREAKRRVYRTLSNISSHEMMYRTDIGANTVDLCRKLNKLGWLYITESKLLEPYKSQPEETLVPR
jgi:hypothetical protein